MATPIYLECTKRRVFACSLEWPGWCRSGRDEEAAIEALAGAAPRYAVVAAEAGVPFAAAAASLQFDVVERLPGTATTEFGAPGVVATADSEPMTKREAARHADLVAASWTVFDRVVAEAPAALRKGPRGGGRDRDAIVRHVVEAEFAYARKIGVRHKQSGADDPAAVQAMRDEVLAVLRGAEGPVEVAEKGWPPRYAARRIAWHVLDHAWEIEDKSLI